MLDRSRRFGSLFPRSFACLLAAFAVVAVALTGCDDATEPTPVVSPPVVQETPAEKVAAADPTAPAPLATDPAGDGQERPAPMPTDPQDDGADHPSERPELRPTASTDAAADDAEPPGVATDLSAGEVVVEKSPADSWTLFRGNRSSTGVSSATLPGKLDVAWEYELEKGGFESSPVIANEVVYLADWDGRVVALNLTNGEELWQIKVDDSFTASPAYDDGRLYVGGVYGMVFCFDAKTGEDLWKFETGAEINSGANFYEDVVLIGSQDHFLYALDAKTGAEKWKFEIADQIRCTPTIVGSRTFLAGCDGKLHVVDVQKGDPLGEVPIDSPTGATPAAVGDFVYFGTHAGDVFCVNWKTIEEVWRHTPESKAEFRNSAAATEEIVVVASRSRIVLGLDRLTGEPKWNYAAADPIEGSPVVVGSRVFLGTMGGTVLALSLDKGEVVWEYELGGSIVASPAVAEGRLIIADDDGKVYCFAAPK